MTECGGYYVPSTLLITFIHIPHFILTQLLSFFTREDLELGVDKGCEVVPSSANPSQAQHLPLLRSPSETWQKASELISSSIRQAFSNG